MAGSIDVVAADQHDVFYVVERLREADRREIAAAYLLPPHHVAQVTLDSSVLAFAARVNGEPFCIFGLTKGSMIYPEHGAPWLVGTPKLEENAIGFLRRSKRYLGHLLTEASHLENYVDARNALSIQWLRWLGFVIEEPKPYGMLGRPFHRFWLET